SSPSGFPISWNLNCLRLKLASSGSEDLSLALLEPAIADSMAPWNALNCSGVELIYDGLSDSGNVGFSNDSANENLIIFQDAMGAWVYQPDILALTTLTFCSAAGGLCKYRGQVLDGDIEFNGREAPFSASEVPLEDHHDFTNTLTHELGHFIGLDHSLDEESTMYFSAPLGEIDKRTLADDDKAGFCTIYEACVAQSECGFCSPGQDDETDMSPMAPGDDNLAGCACDVKREGNGGPFLLYALFLFGAIFRLSRR
ncbi:MAG: matrixin family metalloprotease, partial [Bradymonadia bacterium]